MLGSSALVVERLQHPVVILETKKGRVSAPFLLLDTKIDQ
jgi:hypothetical protein